MMPVENLVNIGDFPRISNGGYKPVENPPI
jgi:hypothetical protein